MSSFNIGGQCELLRSFYDIKSSIDILTYTLYMSSLLFNEQIIPKFLNKLEREKVIERDFDYLSSFKESEPSFMEIKCQRKFSLSKSIEFHLYCLSL